MERKEDYLGDGCYVSYDGWQLRLRAPRESEDHIVYLDHTLMRNLLRFAANHGMVDRKVLHELRDARAWDAPA
jgi:hypothetical protein